MEQIGTIKTKYRFYTVFCSSEQQITFSPKVKDAKRS
jgi:hypothetical protein